MLNHRKNIQGGKHEGIKTGLQIIWHYIICFDSHGLAPYY
ncbi:hypothetical protein MHA01_11110 [Marinococcus halophilus]|uniref:Uncharacterized protein n=1 Tax=Marinococcus halophilus TaxID=1371 RepID=A0A510Y4D5_MARHA|nr:hypothetical protein MHA01_11110 [Marinococcus halophilus]